jgi:rhamnosyltransferase
MDTDKVGIIIPTLNAARFWSQWIRAFDRQVEKPIYRLVIDSSSTDGTATLAKAYGFKVCSIPRAAFRHGGTRQQGVTMLGEAEIVIFMTQDAILASPDAIKQLLNCFEDKGVGVAYGRQLPHPHAGPIGAHARVFNYPRTSHIRTLEHRLDLGIKTAFLSNSFAAYRRSALLEVGGFPIDTIMDEDTYVAGKMLLSGWKIAYCADAQVYHSHDYRFREEFKRYFDIGVFHARETWVQHTFGKVTGEGRRFVISELAYLSRMAPWLLPSAVFRTGLKWMGFRLGTHERLLPVRLKRCLSLHRQYWRYS